MYSACSKMSAVRPQVISAEQNAVHPAGRLIRTVPLRASPGIAPPTSTGRKPGGSSRQQPQGASPPPASTEARARWTAPASGGALARGLAPCGLLGITRPFAAPRPSGRRRSGLPALEQRVDIGGPRPSIKDSDYFDTCCDQTVVNQKRMATCDFAMVTKIDFMNASRLTQ
jgi:hypothetical protein